MGRREAWGEERILDGLEEGAIQGGAKASAEGARGERSVSRRMAEATRSDCRRSMNPFIFFVS